MNITLGSLFDGIGGFPYAGTLFGITPIWASEIEPWPIKVTEKHFPNMKHLGDITQINGAEIEPVDIITFGSPCTRLSVAGKHDGFDINFECQGNKDSPHEIYSKTIRATDKYQYEYTTTCPVCGQVLFETNESALFFHAIRVIREMRDATNGTYPRFAVWENVPGAFSSNKGEDFRAVLEEIAETEIPMPRSGKWANAGMVRTERVDVAWRVLDAQYWGVPQRRRRIFLVADFGGQCAGEILFKPESVSGDTSESGEARKEAAGAVGDGIEGTDWLTGWDCQEKRIFSDKGVSPTLQARKCGGGGSYAGYIAICITAKNNRLDAESQTFVIEPRSKDGVCRVHTDGIVPTLNTSQGGQRQPCVIVFNGDQSEKTRSMGEATEQAPTLRAEDPCHVAYPEPANTLLGKPNLSHRDDTDTVVVSSYAVRRLTPLECLRLQGFPDWWLDIEGMSDTQKYKAIGNSVAIPYVKFVLGGIARVLQI